MRMLPCIMLFVTAAVSYVFSASIPGKEGWWTNAIFYQILVDSYKDSNNDGIGDIAGVTQNIGHVKSLGARAIILSPIYDKLIDCDSEGITDFSKIREEYGTFEDFQQLLKESKKLGIRVLLTLPLQSMSIKSKWFTLSENKTGGFEKFFIWNDKNGRIALVNNQIQHKYEWKWSETRNQYYGKDTHGAELNLADGNLFDQIKHTMAFWLEHGISGFKISFNDDDVKLYNGYVGEIRSLLNQYTISRGGDEVVLIVDSVASYNLAMSYYDADGAGGAHLVFNDNIFTQLDKSSTARDIKFIIDRWLTYLPDNSIATWATGDPEHTRLASKLGNLRLDAINTLALFLPGVAITNQGDEIGMESSSAVDKYKECLEEETESKTPYQWDDTASGGFSKNDKTWVPLATNYRFTNVKIQKAATKSHLKMYQSIAQARQSSTLTEGDIITKVFSNNILVLVRKLRGKETFVAVMNFGKNGENVNITSMDLTELITYASNEQSSLNMGDKVSAENLRLAAGETIVFMAAPTQCTNEGPVNKIMNKLSDAMHKINGFFGS